MTIDEIKKYIFRMARQRQLGNVSVDLMNQCLEFSQLEFIKKPIGDIDRYENGLVPVTKQGAEATTAISDAVAPLVENTTISVVSQLAAKPGNYLYRYNLEYTLSSSKIGIDIIPYAHRNYRINSSIVAPDALSPLGFSIGANWEIWPASIGSVVLTYVRVPLTPKWNYNPITPTVFLSGGSQGLEVPQQYHEEICLMTLERIATSLRDSELFQLAKAIK